MQKITRNFGDNIASAQIFLLCVGLAKEIKWIWVIAEDLDSIQILCNYPDPFNSLYHTDDCVFHATQAGKLQAHAGSKKNRKRCKK